MLDTRYNIRPVFFGLAYSTFRFALTLKNHSHKSVSLLTKVCCFKWIVVKKKGMYFLFVVIYMVFLFEKKNTGNS